jgi:hypothetical protein
MSVKTQAEKNFDMMIRNLDAYPVSECQVTGLVDEYYTQSFVFENAVPDTYDQVLLLINLLKEKGVTNFKEKIWIRPAKFAFISRIRDRLKGYPVNILEGEAMPAIPLIPITNPAVSKRNPDGQGRITIYPEITKKADDFRKNSDLPGCCNLIEGWWVGKPTDFRNWLLPQLYKMEFTPGHHYDVLDRLWANFYKPGYSGPVEVINKEEGYHYFYDFASKGIIIDAGSVEANDLLFKTQTTKKYNYYRGAFDSIKKIKELTEKSTDAKTVEIVSGLKYKDSTGFLDIPTYKTFSTTQSIVDTTKQDSSSWRLVKGYYGPDSSDPIEKINPHAWKRHRFVVVPPGPYLTNSMVAINFESEEEALRHKEHLESDLVNFQVEVTRRGKSISEEQTKFIGHLDEFEPLSNEQKDTLKGYFQRYESK